MDPSKNIALLIYDTEIKQNVQISPVWPALHFTEGDITKFTLHPDIIANAILHASFSESYEDTYNVRKYKLLHIKKISFTKNYPIDASQDDFFPVLDDDETMQEDLEGANVWGEPDY
eukprot:666917-Pleurochrysis_carterae.AAC.1